MAGRRSVNLVSVWIVIIFSVIAATLAAMLLIVYSSALNEELRYTLREQITVLADNADLQVMEPIRAEAVRRLTAKAGFADVVQSVSRSDEAESGDIRALAAWCAEVNAAVPQSSRVDIYFPDKAMSVGSEGVRFIADKKYLVQASNYAFLLSLNPSEASWRRRVFRENGEDVPYIIYVRPCPGIFQPDRCPLVMTSIREEQLGALLKKALRTLGGDDRIFLADFDGVIWSAEDVGFIGAQLPRSESALQAVSLPDGTQALLVESGDSTGSFTYVMAHPDPGRLLHYDSTISVWVILCVVLIGAGMVCVLWVLMTNYARPMRRLMRRFSLEETESGSSLIALPSQHFTKLESAFMDLSQAREESERYLSQSRPALRQAWLNCLISGEARYAAPMPHLDIAFPHPYFQAVLLSERPTEAREKQILDAFAPSSFTVAAFDSREKERVYLFNHGQDASAVPDILNAAGKAQDGISFGVGILARTPDMIPASFRCARRALFSRYFNMDSVVCVFDPDAEPVRSEDALPRLIEKLNSLSSVIRSRPTDEADQAIDGFVSQLKESVPSLSVMRSVMLLTAALLCKSVYDIKAAPEEVFGDDLMNVYYHIEDIGEFAARLKKDSRALNASLSRESSEGNRSIVEYAIHHIRGTPPAELSTQSIADALSISTGHLSRVFHQATGKKLVDYLQEIRMEYAAKLLREGRLSNEEICEAVGYSRPQYFSAKFRERYGLTVNEYRRRCKDEAGSGEDS